MVVGEAVDGAMQEDSFDDFGGELTFETFGGSAYETSSPSSFTDSETSFGDSISDLAGSWATRLVCLALAT